MLTAVRKLTKAEVYSQYSSVISISNRNKTDGFLNKNYDLIVKLLTVKKSVQTEMEALEESKATVQDILADKRQAEYNLPVFTEDELKIMIGGPEELEAFETLLG